MAARPSGDSHGSACCRSEARASGGMQPINTNDVSFCSTALPHNIHPGAVLLIAHSSNLTLNGAHLLTHPGQHLAHEPKTAEGELPGGVSEDMRAGERQRG